MAFVVGTVVGTGIYLKPAHVTEMAPEPWQNLLLWTAGGLFALFGAIVYARLSAVWPKSGGAYVYLTECYGPWVGSLLLAADILLGRPAAVGALATGLGLVWGLTAEMTLLLALLAIATLTLAQLLGRRATAGMQLLLTGLQMLPFLAIVGAGVSLPSVAPELRLGGGEVQWASGFLAVMWAYDGWYNVTILGGEVKRPEVNLRRSLIGGVLLVTAVYVGLNALLLAKVPYPEVVGTGVAFLALLQGWDLEFLQLALKVGLTLAILATLNGVLACGPSMLAASGLGGANLDSTKRSTLLFAGWCLGLLLLFAGLPSNFALFDQLSEFTAVVVAGLSGLTVTCLFHLRRLGHSIDIVTVLAALGFLSIDVTLMLMLAAERPGLAVAGTVSVLVSGTLLHIVRRYREISAQEA